MSVEAPRGLFSARTPADLADLSARAVQIGVEFVSGHRRGGKVVRYASEKELIERFAEGLPEHGSDDETMLAALGTVAEWSVAQHDPRYLAFPDTGSASLAWLPALWACS